MPRKHTKSRRRGKQAFDEHEYRDIGQRVSTAVHSALASAAGRTVLPADVVINTTSFVDLTGLSFSVIAGVPVHFQATIYYTASSSSGGSAWAINGPASPTQVFYHSQSSGFGGTTDEFGVTYDDIAMGTSSFNSVGANMAKVEGLIIPSINGTVVLRGAAQSGYSVTALADVCFVEYQ